jgi:hypothetical protein
LNVKRLGADPNWDCIVSGCWISIVARKHWSRDTARSDVRPDILNLIDNYPGSVIILWLK